MEEELAWFLNELDKELVGPLLDNHLRTPSRFTFVAPGPIQPTTFEQMEPSPIGLSMMVESSVPSGTIYPFDERALEERSVPTRDLWTVIEAGIVQ